MYKIQLKLILYKHNILVTGLVYREKQQQQSKKQKKKHALSQRNLANLTECYFKTNFTYDYFSLSLSSQEAKEYEDRGETGRAGKVHWGPTRQTTKAV